MQGLFVVTLFQPFTNRKAPGVALASNVTPTDSNMRGKGGHGHAQVIKPACKQFAGMGGVVHVHDATQ